MKMLGLIDREKMNRVYNMADVFLLPSYEELFPMTILEAMSCQVPVIVRNLPIYNNILFDYCLRGEDKDEFGYQLEELKEKPGYYKIWKEQAAKGHGYYSRDRMKVEWEYFYQRICTEMEIEKEGAAGKEKIFLWKKEQKSFGRH
jgi:1,2-diacylglycerol-3-alpha-glucose alpha-1,2-galactosyltransferase